MWQKRAARDIKDLLDNGFEVTGENGNKDYNIDSFLTSIEGPKDSPYENCFWHVRFTITPNFPFSSPSVGFVEKILHANIDEASGSICLDALNKAWSPHFTLRHICETILPYLLSYPNPDDGLNRDAAYLMKTNPTAFDKRVRQHSKANAYKVKDEKEQ